MTGEDFSGYCAAQVRAQDPDRFVLALLAPTQARDALLSLYAFNCEIARVREAVSEAPLGEIRLQWWRDEIGAIYAGQPLRHGISAPLARAVAGCGLTRARFDRLIDARSADLDDRAPGTVADLLRYAEDTAAPLVALALEAVGASSSAALEAARHAGIAWSLIGLVRSLPFHLRARRRFLPDELVARHEIDSRDLHEARPNPPLTRAVTELAGLVGSHIQQARAERGGTGRAAVPVLLQVRFAEIYLRRLEAFGYDPFDPRLAVKPPMAAWRLLLRRMTGRY